MHISSVENTSQHGSPYLRFAGGGHIAIILQSYEILPLKFTWGDRIKTLVIFPLLYVNRG